MTYSLELFCCWSRSNEVSVGLCFLKAIASDKLKDSYHFTQKHARGSAPSGANLSEISRFSKTNDYSRLM